MTAVDVLRRFNRTYTQRIGALDDSFLGLGLPLGTARLLFEIGADGPDGAVVADLRARLGLDSGYLSRLLRDLEGRGLAHTAPAADDRRRRVVRLTDDGTSLRRRLDERSDALASSLVEALTEGQRDRLVEALATADLLVRAATIELREVDPAGASAAAAMRLYFDELDRRFPDGFDPGEPAPPETVTLATSDGVVVACGGLQQIDHGDPRGVDEVKRMWVDPSWRGAGLGSRLLRHLEDQARARGRGVVRLDTNGALTDAIALYERAGYRRIERYNDNPYAELFFEKTLS